MNTRNDTDLLKWYVRQEESRERSIGWSLKAARRTLKNLNIDWRGDVEQQE